MNTSAAVEMRNITKRFGAKVLANDDVSLDMYRGEILALLGENGSGKTTLMNMLSGIYFPDSGTIHVNGEPVVISSPRKALELGIGMIHQHFKLVDVLTAAENIVLGLEEKLDLKKASQRIREICDAYGFEVDPNQKIYNMSVSQKQTVEIVKVLYRGADILILDEPTAVLTPQETEKLFAVLRNPQAERGRIPVGQGCRPADGPVYRHAGDKGNHRPADDRHDGRPVGFPEHQPDGAGEPSAAAGAPGRLRAE